MATTLAAAAAAYNTATGADHRVADRALSAAVKEALKGGMAWDEVKRVTGLSNMAMCYFTR